MSFKDEFSKTPAAEGGGSFELIPVGEYQAMIDDSWLDMTKTPPRLSLTYKIVDGEFKNRKLWANYTLSGQGFGFLKKDLKTLGADYSNVEGPEDVARLMFKNIGRGVQIYVAQKEWNGKTYNNAYLNKAESAPVASQEIDF